ncbi:MULTISPECIES: 6-phosphofructokinase [unclassified Gordonia (in: high G+C Gram-positive bacteria)]|uniref:6-phosphofructokinase n=1 Tax=unclassified Gordonia (in: high G+C Gram-positive bacteria) TaxID=2657482 RepID=UPI0009913E9A|nr:MULTISPECIES: 6-phosphofructokinase [unclassified Gordonia (in: high G+C Gram-positive bacteria)]MCT1353612.1 6-phosphofructokinase [Gordonia sp. p3-SID1431]
MAKRFGILTSGGDCPGLNAVIRGAVLKGETVYGHEFVGFRDGWAGLVYGDIVELSRSTVRGLSNQGGTILGTSRFGPYSEPDGGPENIKKVLKNLEIDGVIAIGGEGTAAASKRLFDDGINIVGVPKTIDNDIAATDYTFGFNTAVEIATEAIDRLRTTGNSHKRCMVLEVMGRHAGWIALHSGIAGGAHVILIPENPESLDQICAWVTSVKSRGRSPMVVVAEGFKLPEMKEAYSTKGLDGFNRPRLGGVAEVLAPLIEERTGIETRATILGHIQRGGVPSAYDRVLATRMGMATADLVAEKGWGQMVALHGTDIARITFDEALGELKTVPLDQYKEIRVIFG